MPLEHLWAVTIDGIACKLPLADAYSRHELVVQWEATASPVITWFRSVK